MHQWHTHFNDYQTKGVWRIILRRMNAEVEVIVRTDKSQYVEGDTVYGSLYVHIPSACKATCIKLVIRGMELCEYDYQYVLQRDADSFQTKLGQRKARKDLLRIELKLVEYQNGFPEGYFAYPFQYQLPHGLPGVFHAKYEDTGSGRIWQGVTKYVIGALLEFPETPPEHKGETPLVILDSSECSQSELNVVSAMGSVKTFFCIHRGDIKVSSRLDKSAYYCDEKVTLHLHLENNSAVDILDSTIKVIRIIKLYGTDKVREEEEYSAHTVYDTIVELAHTGCSKNHSKKSSIELELEKFCLSEIGLPSSTSGSIIKCSYVIDVDVHVPWAPDIEVRQPLLIKPPPNKSWEEWKPPEWVGKCTQEQVSGTCAVPQNVLASQSFSGMPLFQPIL